MSQAIFPAVTEPLTSGWNYGLPLKATPRFKTLVQTPTSNRGQVRISLTPWPIWDFELQLPGIFGDPQTFNAGYQQIIGFYGQMAGAANDWLFDFPGNDTVPSTSPQVIATGDGVTTIFAISHAIGGMLELIQNFKAGSPSIYLGGVLQTSGYAIDAYGNLYFNSAPAGGVQIAWSGSWYTRCRFLDDALQDLQLIRGNGATSLWQLRSLKFESVLL